MGVLSKESKDLRITEIILVSQTVSAVHVELDMTWWADCQVELYEKHGIEPWQCSCWLHTHPRGIKHPSGTDEETMHRSFGSWNLALMLILTQDGHFYGRADFDHEFSNRSKHRIMKECEVVVDWASTEGLPITHETLETWEKEFKERVKDQRDTFGLQEQRKGSRFASNKDQDRKGRKDKLLKPAACLLTPEREVSDYEDACQWFGLDPDDPCSFESVHGFWPDSDECAELDDFE